MRLILALLAALLPAAALAQSLPSATFKTTTTERLVVTGTGSSGDASGLIVTSDGTTRSLASWFASVPSSVLLPANNLSDLVSAAAARTNLGLAAVATTGAYGDLSGRPVLATVATSGQWADLLGKPTLFDGTWNSLTGKPTLATVATSGSASDLGAGTLQAARLPLPAATTLGGVKSLAATSNTFLTAIGTDGTPTAAQPSFTNISGTVAATQLPNPTASTKGGVQSGTAGAGQFVTGISTAGALTYGTPAIPSSTNALSEGASNLYFTQARARASISASGSLSYNSTTGAISYTAPTLAAVATSGSASDLGTGTLPAARLPAPTAGALGGVKSATAAGGSFVTGIDTTGALTFGMPTGGGSGPANTDALPEGTSNLYFTQGRARSSISATGSLAYNATTGVLSYTAPTLATVATSGAYTDLSSRPTLATVATSGSASDLGTGTLPAARLPLPSATTLGGVQSKAATASQFLTAIGTDGVPVSAQPAFSNISGTVAASQLPAPTASTLGGVQSKAATASQFLTSISTAGVPAAAQPAFSDLSGQATTAQLPSAARWITAQSLANPGYRKWNDGLIEQWGTVAGAAGGNLAVTFPTAFTANVFSVQTTVQQATTASTTMESASSNGLSTTGFTCVVRYVSGGTVGAAGEGCHWYAVGN
ncbi:beta strand repeat-containing protein [Methylobacterium oxalidis]|uniref:Putative tail fiber protein gp53-like C-terminal domain-containing protein n=1 Tax=Methylobacterium oxalidis TaxID=944322 RepID=A0A512J244_9HYPH|nr:hypothetical protein [Methylobacterium oxalidis]GEP04032.1 hypothetical protein MOX02_20700 [Methylobacterium oxalidis]GJE34843.1 hypothetical protein LDDCCGHA_5058 [Methylobacterium oxalidis]GLS64063.1 hypothetical protein GCM10007888_24440 [Methylobacterium oxalidis]